MAFIIKEVVSVFLIQEDASHGDSLDKFIETDARIDELLDGLGIIAESRGEKAEDDFAALGTEEEVDQFRSIELSASHVTLP